MVSGSPGRFPLAIGLAACHDRTITGRGKASVELAQFGCGNTLIGSIKASLTLTCPRSTVRLPAAHPLKLASERVKPQPISLQRPAPVTPA
jgi:hypothetical protein